MTMLDDDFSALEARLRRDLGPLADALLVDASPLQAPTSEARPLEAPLLEARPSEARPLEALPSGAGRPEPALAGARRWLAVAAAVVALAVGAGAVWRASQDDGRIETGPVDTGPVESDPDSGSDPDGEAATDSTDEESEFDALQRLVDELPDDQRIPDSPYDESGGERFDHVWAEEGLWVYSRPDPDQPGPAMDAGEILLLEDWGGPIIDSWLLGYFPGGDGGQIEISNDAVYCMFVGDGGLPDSQYCRIDRTTGEVDLVIHPSAIDGGDEAFYRDLYADSGIDWRVVPPGQDDAVRPFGWLYVEEGEISDGVGPVPERPTMVDESRLARLDPDTLDVIETVDLAATGERVFPCPFRDSGVPQLEEAGIPPAVQATRQAIVEAAARCDVDALEALSAGQLTVPMADGGWGMIALAMMLTQPPDVVEGGDEEGGQATYLFPSELVGLTKGEVAAVSRFYGRDGDDHQTVILEDGTWLPAGS
jgi:hypothetical protein